MPTMQEVARGAGVSVATVSRTLTGADNVSPQSQDRVWDAIRGPDHQPDQVARSLRRRRSTQIGFVVSSIENQFFTEAVAAVVKAALEVGLNVAATASTESFGRRNNTCACWIPGFHRPVQSLSRASRPDFHCPNDEEAARTGVNYLIGDGKRNLETTTGLPEAFTTQMRLHGYRRLAKGEAALVGGR